MKTPVGLILHGLHEVNKALKDGQYFFADIRREGIVLHEIDDEPLAEPQYLSAGAMLKAAIEHFENRFSEATLMLKTAIWQASQTA
ncbi:hypothetical protein RHI9324_04674 [Rhizobium sp. CECT 9324]|nr:hypothetical protein RHI9324_04674 [Rhizobium sp. CECT 9324]